MWEMAFVATRCAGSLVGMAEWGGGLWVGVCSILAIRMPLPYSQDLWNLFPMSLHLPSFSCVWNPLGREEGEVKSVLYSFPFCRYLFSAPTSLFSLWFFYSHLVLLSFSSC